MVVGDEGCGEFSILSYSAALILDASTDGPRVALDSPHKSDPETSHKAA